MLRAGVGVSAQGCSELSEGSFRRTGEGRLEEGTQSESTVSAGRVENGLSLFTDKSWWHFILRHRLGHSLGLNFDAHAPHSRWKMQSAGVILERHKGTGQTVPPVSSL